MSINARKLDIINIKFLLFGFILSQKITLIGQIYLLEVFSILYLILNVTKIKFNPLLKKLLVVLLFHLMVVIYSDYINQSSIDLFLKGFFSLPVFFATVLFLFNYFNNKYFIFISFLIGFLMGDLLINNFINIYNPFFLVILGNGVLVFLVYVCYFFMMNLKKIRCL